MFYPRRIYPELLSHLTDPEVTVLTGMRRTGKTAILKELYKNLPGTNKILIDLENRINRELFGAIDYEEIWSNLKKNYALKDQEKAFIFLDEIQFVPEMPSIIKYLFDHYGAKFIVTGSSSFYLKNLFSESLAGRKRIFELFPLTFDELLVFKDKQKNISTDSFLDTKKSDWWQKAYSSLYEEYLRFGGFPAVVLAQSDSQKFFLLKDILYSYIEQDVKGLSHFKKISDLEKLIRLLPTRVGQKVDISKISREISLSRQTVVEYLSFLEKTYVIFLLSPYTKNPDREISKAAKLYFCDTGLANILSPLSSGQLLENAIFHVLRVKYRPHEIFTSLHYYQKKNGQEIDFVLDKEAAIEVKETATDFDTRILARLAQGLILPKYYLISKNSTLANHVLYSSQL